MTDKLHICVIGNGSDVHVRNRTKVFVELGHTVTIITDEPSELAQVNEILLDLPQHDVINPIASTVAHLRQVRQVKADIYFVHFPRRHSAWAVAIANVRPLVVTVMGGDVNFDTRAGPTSDFQRYLTTRVLDKANKILAKSNALIQTIAKHGDYQNKTMRVIWGVDLTFWYKRTNTQLKRQLGLGDGDFVLLSPKVLTSFYNIHLLIEAMQDVVHNYPQTKLLVTERWPQPGYKEQLIQQIEQLNLQDKVLFVGEIPHLQLPEYYSMSDLVVTVPPSDGLPQAMFEAMACEVPYMVGNLPQYREVVTHLESAYFVEFNPESIAQGIKHLIEDEDLRETIRRNGLEVVRSIADIHQEAKRVEKIFYQLRDDTSISRDKSIDFRMIFWFVGLGFKRFITKIFGKIVPDTEAQT